MSIHMGEMRFNIATAAGPNVLARHRRYEYLIEGRFAGTPPQLLTMTPVVVSKCPQHPPDKMPARLRVARHLLTGQHR